MKPPLLAHLGIFLLSTPLATPALPHFTSAGTMSSPRAEHTATLLPNGKVLVAAGFIYYNFICLSSAELFNPANGLWQNTGSLNTPRGRQTTTLLPNGKVLVAGGDGQIPFTGNLPSAELYNPATETWTNTGSLNIGRELHTATLLANGKVLVVGGSGSGPVSLASAELYDPATGIWTPTGSMKAARYHHTATLLPNGKVLVTGGAVNFPYGLASAELYDPATEQWTDTYPMSTNRVGHTATLLPNGKVLVVGGNENADSLYSSELYDPATEMWTATGSGNVAREWHTAILLSNGKVLVAGGRVISDIYRDISFPSAELYDPTNGTWMATGAMTDARGYGHKATLLPSGRVLFTGGYGTNDILSSAELFDPTIATVTLGHLSQIYDGTPKNVSVTTGPPGLTVNLTYNGSTNAPISIGSYTVIGTVNDNTYTGSATNTLVIHDVAGFFTYSTNGSAITITRYLGQDRDVAIPSIITGLPVTSIEDWAFESCYGLVSVTIPNSVTNIGSGAFFACTNLTNVTIPASVINIGVYAFVWCNRLTAFTTDANNPAYCSVAGVLFDKSTNTLIQCPGGKTGSLTIPDNVTSIRDSAFCSGLTAIYFRGNAPAADVTSCFADTNAIVYYLTGTTGWGDFFSNTGLPTVLWNPQAQNDTSFGVQTNQFGFNITGTASIPIVVEACTNLANATWTPLQTCTVTNGFIYFSDPNWTNYPARSYRIRSP